MPKTLLTTLEQALMGLLSLAPGSGYDVISIFADTPFAHFSSSPGAIYPALKRLEGRGLLIATFDNSTAMRPRKVYSLTDEGQAILYAWLHESVTRDELIHNGQASILRFSLSEGHLSVEETVAYLDGFRRVIADYLKELASYRERMARRHTFQQLLALDHGIRAYECQAVWIEDAIRELRRHHAEGIE